MSLGPDILLIHEVRTPTTLMLVTHTHTHTIWGSGGGGGGGGGGVLSFDVAELCFCFEGSLQVLTFIAETSKNGYNQ